MRVRDYPRAAALWTELAERGDRDARYQLGSLYRTGRGVPRDPGRAFRCGSRRRKPATCARSSVSPVSTRAAGASPPIATRRCAGTARRRSTVTRARVRASRNSNELRRLRIPSPPARREASAERPARPARPAPEPVSPPDPLGWTERADAAAHPGFSPLAIAAWRGETERVRALLAHGAELEARDGEGHTPLTRAAWRGHVEIAVLLLEAGADREARDGEGRTASYLAAAENRAACLRALLERGADANARSAAGESALGAAIAHGHADVVTLLLAHGADPAVRDARRQPLLCDAVAMGRGDLAAALLGAGVEVEARCGDGLTPLARAASAGMRRSRARCSPPEPRPTRRRRRATRR